MSAPSLCSWKSWLAPCRVGAESGGLMPEESSAYGRCLCGGIRYAVSGELRNVINCHCERCRQFTGHHLAATSAKREDISIEDVGSLLSWYFPVPEAGYGFCSLCGSSMFWQSEADHDRMSICAGTLDPPTGLRTIQAWWTGQASDYYSRPGVPELDTE